MVLKTTCCDEAELLRSVAGLPNPHSESGQLAIALAIIALVVPGPLGSGLANDYRHTLRKNVALVQYAQAVDANANWQDNATTLQASGVPRLRADGTLLGPGQEYQIPNLAPGPSPQVRAEVAELLARFFTAA